MANQLNLAIYLLPEALYIRLRVPRVVQRDIPAQELQSRVNRLAVGHHPVVAMVRFHVFPLYIFENSLPVLFIGQCGVFV